MAITKADIRNKVLQNIGVLAAGETAEAADAVLVEDAYDYIYDSMFTNGSAQWTDNTDVPEYAVIPMTDLVSVPMLAPFDVQEPRVSLVIAQARTAERRLIRQVSPPYRHEPTQFDNY